MPLTYSQSLRARGTKGFLPSTSACSSVTRWHFLYFLPLPHQHGAFRPSVFFATALVTYTTSLSLPAFQCKRCEIGSSSTYRPIGFAAVYNELSAITGSKLFRTIRDLVLSVLTAILGTAIAKSEFENFYRPRRVADSSLKALILSVTVAFVLGSLVYFEYRSRTSPWLWILGFIGSGGGFCWGANHRRSEQRHSGPRWVLSR